MTAVRGTVEIAEGHYGKNFEFTGVLSDEVGRVEEGARRLPGGTWIYVQPDGRTSKIVCSEIIRAETEDGPVSGRCGKPIDTREGFACPEHVEIIKSWRDE